MNNTAIVYLLGAGRSGTTMLATVLNSHPNITSVGEMHQFFEHLELGKKCSCGKNVDNCSFWKEVINNLFLEQQISTISKLVKQKERHINIFKYLFKRTSSTEYIEIQNKVFKLIQKQAKTEWILDSSKYIARYLLLKQSKRFKIKGVYVVRDVRGVINSFKKQVQTPKKPFATILYYWLINFFGQLIYYFDKDILKIRYEEFVSNPEQVTNKIYEHIFKDTTKVTLPDIFETPHIIGGNRMKSNKNISIRNDEKCKEVISRSKQVLYYVLTFPLMILNKYKV